MGSEFWKATVVVDVDNLGQLVVVKNWKRKHQLAATLPAGSQQVELGSDSASHRRDDLFSNSIQRRVGHLSEELLEVIEQQPWPFAEHRNRGIGTHRTQRLGTVFGHRGDDDLQLFVGISEDLLTPQHAVATEHHVLAIG